MSRYKGAARYNGATRHLYDTKFKANQRFVGVDGEGGTVPDSETLFGSSHKYLLLRAGEFTTEKAEGLTWEDCFAFLTNLPHNRIYVGYFFDYDVTMMIRTMPEFKAARLLNRHLRIAKDGSGGSMPVDIGDYQCDYLPHKEFKVRHKDQKHFTIISDVGQFFQTSFVKTLEKWEVGTEQEREMIRKGKAMRADFAELTEETKAYNALECLLLEQLMENFRATCIEVGYVPRKWQGPGNLASAMFEKHGIPKRDEVPILANTDFREMANSAYYGGRFETTATGPVPGPIYQYDINSAYPAITRQLPCLTHGSWRRVTQRPDRGTAVWFGQIHFNHDAPRYLYNLPVRLDNGNIQYPRQANGVYWSTEIEAAEKAGTKIDFATGWVYENHCECRWFDFIDPLYLRRIQLGKTTKGYVLKLGGNSLYGKIAQSIGYAPYANPVWAGLITAGCRAMLIDAYSQAPDDCYMLATDGIFSGVPLDLPLSNQLGEWEETVHEDGMFIVQPGIYYLSSGDVKTRGVERGRISNLQPEFERAWSRFLGSRGIDHTVSVPVDNFITAKQAIARRKWQLAGSWERTTRDISFDWSTKRKRSIAWKGKRGELRTVPHEGGAGVVSVGYNRIIGGAMIVSDADRYTDPGLEETRRMAEQPDWVEPLFDVE